MNMETQQNEIWRDQLLKMNDEENKFERRKILKNVVIISFGFLLNFTAYGVGGYGVFFNFDTDL